MHEGLSSTKDIRWRGKRACHRSSRAARKARRVIGVILTVDSVGVREDARANRTLVPSVKAAFISRTLSPEIDSKIATNLGNRDDDDDDVAHTRDKRNEKKRCLNPD